MRGSVLVTVADRKRSVAGVRQVARASTARDFRAKHRIQFSTAPTLQPLNEHGEFVSGSMNDYDQTYAVTTFGRIVGFTRQAMVNDDLGAFADTTRRMGQAAAAFEANFLANVVSSNPTLADGNAVFCSAHGNLTGTGAGTTLSLTTLSAGRQAMRAQTGLLGELIDVTPRYLLVGPANETTAEQLVSEISPIQAQDVNPHVDPAAGTFSIVLADGASVVSATPFDIWKAKRDARPA